jgi:A/G-specific adenine glycosylase
MDMHGFVNPDLTDSPKHGHISKNTIQAFRSLIYRFYRSYGREFPWRHTRDPYRVLVSEVMLQQTQVDRVIKKYGVFVERFPDIHSLAHAPLKEVLKVWQGLGYNRRCLSLKRSAGLIVAIHDGVVPDAGEDLTKLPGIGPATAAGIRCFAFGKPALYLETNIRSVFLHLFFTGHNGVHDREILPLLEQTLDRESPREWYFALMDYGSMLKREVGNLNTRSRHYAKQSPFKGSNRQLRGRVLALLLNLPGLTTSEITSHLQADSEKVMKILTILDREGFIHQDGQTYTISS